MITHTKGPWEVGDGSWKSGHVDINAKTHGSLAVVVTFVDDEPYAEGLANARLIAAAPDLLASLKVMTKAFESNLANHENTDWFEEWNTAMSAITKATKGE